MTISVDRNVSYGGPNVTEKYSPLLNIQFLDMQGADRAAVSGLVAYRNQLFRDLDMLPKPLALAVPSWDATVKSEKGHLPPLVVLSSNRSKWIAEGVATADRTLERLRKATFNQECDPDAICLSDSEQSPPIYAPKRLGPAPNRNVYIVVHASEYRAYKAALRTSGITVVGWRFFDPAGGRPIMSGFGASRFAAIELCKELRRLGAPWDKAWLLDDNVVAMKKSPGFVAMEDELTKAKPGTICAGAKGGSSADPFQKIQEWAVNEKNAGRTGYQGVPPSATQGLVQQAACWNIDELIKRELNFGLAFVASHSDVSLDNYLDTARIPYLYYVSIGVQKEEVRREDGNEAITSIRRELTATIAAAGALRTNGDKNTPPTQIVVEPANRRVDGDAQPLTEFVGKVLRNSQLNAKATDYHVQAAALCHAVEQIACAGLKANIVNAEPRRQMFQVNFPDDQVVAHFGRP